MIRPNVEDEADEHYYYNTGLDLSKMPKGLAAGEYARSILDNMRTKRSVKQYDTLQSMLPDLTWSTLVAHMLQYGLDNKWGPDDAETAMCSMLQNGASLTGYWKADLVDWPFEGDRALLLWTDHVVKGHLSRANQSKHERELPETDGNACTQLGRWFGQRPHLLNQAPPVIQHLVFYVETVDSMSDAALQNLKGRSNANWVLFCGMGRERMRTGTKHKKQRGNLDRMLSSVLPRPKNTEWVDHAFRSFALGLAWEMRAQGNPTVFNRVGQLINNSHQWASPAQLALCMDDDSWVSEVMTAMVDAAKEDLPTVVRRGKNYGVEPFYPNKMEFRTQREQFKKVLAKASPRQDWSTALYKMTLASALRAHFCSHTSYYDLDHERLLQAQPAMDAMTCEDKEFLFEAMVAYIEGTRGKGRAHKDTNPWGSYMEAMFDSWASRQTEDIVETQTALAFFVEWLAKWSHPVQSDLNMMVMINNEAETLGAWLHQAIVQRHTPVTVDMGQDVAHLLQDLFDFSESSTDHEARVVPNAEKPKVVGAPGQSAQHVVHQPMDLGDVGGLF